ncbi:hypothetical protein GCM10009722_07100 [Williamsia deligens]
MWVLGLAIVAHHNPLGWADGSVLQWTVDHRSAALTSLVEVVTVAFSPLWVLIWTVLAAAVLALRDHAAHRAVQLVAVVGVAGVACEVVKLAVERHRPPVIDQVGTRELAMSFPSGHVSGATALVLGLAIVVTAGSARRVRLIAVACAVCVSLVAAGTRLYLGVHYLTDVTAALVLSTAVAATLPALAASALDHLAPHLPPRWQDMVNDPEHAAVATTKG